MELEVLRTKGIPDTGVISIRAGSTRRQAQVAALDRPLKFPGKPQDCTGFKIDVLDLLGSSRMTLDDPLRLSHEYSTVLEPASDLSPSDMEVTFTLRKAGDSLGAAYDSAASDVDRSSVRNGSKETVPITFEKLDLNQDGVITKEEFDKAMNEGKAEWVQKREKEAREYLEDHGLVAFMQYLMQSLMKDKPADPYLFLQKQVAMRAAQVRLAGGPDGSLLQSLLAKLDTASSVVTEEQLAALEKEASETGERLRQDNEKLRSTANDLKAEYDRMLQESLAYKEKMEMNLPPKFQTTARGSVEAIPGETPQLHAFREIALVQDEVCGLAKENSALVEELARMRSAVDAVRGEIGGMIGSEAGMVR